MRASARRCANIIKSLIKEDGTRCQDLQGLLDMASDFYYNIFSPEPCVSLDEILDAVPKKVGTIINEMLTKDYPAEEI